MSLGVLQENIIKGNHFCFDFITNFVNNITQLASSLLDSNKKLIKFASKE